MFRKLAAGKKFHEVLSVMLQLWSGVLLIYTFGMNPLLGFFVSAVLWRLVKFDGKQKLNKKKLSLIVLLIAVSGHYKASEFVLNAVIGFTVFQALSFFSKSKCEARQNWLPMVYVTMAIYYTLRMTLVFSVPEILMPIHEGYMFVGKFLSENKIVEWIILMSLMALDMSIFLKQGKQEKLPLIMGLVSGICGLEDMTAIVSLSIVGKVIFKVKNGADEKNECEESVQQAGKIYKL